MNAGFFLLMVVGLLVIFYLLLFILKHIKDLKKQIAELREQVKTLSNTQQKSPTHPPVLLKKISSDLDNIEPVVEQIPIKRPSRKPTLFRQTDWEKFIGENLINKIGIIVLVLGISFFVRYAIEREWINEIGRVLIGLKCGGALLGIAHWLRQKYPAFSSVLVGGGLAILYFTVALAFHQYHLLFQTMAFICMVAITGLSVLMALVYNRKELAILALFGGFGSPFMTSAGGENFIILFSYILILDAGMLVLAYFKRWPIITFITFAATVSLYASWLFSGIAWVNNAPYIATWVFGLLYYITFFLMDIIYNLRRERKFTWSELALLISNTTFFYLTALYLLGNIQQGSFQGIYTAGLAFFNGVTVWLLFTRTRSDRNFIYLIAGLAFSFLYLAILLEILYQMQASTLLYETRVLLLAIYHYLFIAMLLFYARRSILIKYSPYLLFLGLAGLLNYISLALGVIPELRNTYTITGTIGAVYYLHFAALVLIICIIYFGYKLIEKKYPATAPYKVFATWLIAASIVFVFSTELDNLLVITTYDSTKPIASILKKSHQIGFAVLWSFISFGFMLAGMQLKNKVLRFISLTLFGLTLLKLFLFDIKDLSAGSRITAFILLGILLLIVSFLYQKLKFLIISDDMAKGPPADKSPLD